MIDEQINWLFHENITFGNIFVESESLNIFTIVICMPARWEVSNNSVSMSSFSDAVNINKYSDLHFSYIFYWTKVRSLHCQYHSLTYLNDEAVYSVLLVDLSKGRMEGLNRCWSTIFKLNFDQDLEVKVYLQGFAFKSDLFNIFEAGASPKEDFLSTLQCWKSI